MNGLMTNSTSLGLHLASDFRSVGTYQTLLPRGIRHLPVHNDSKFCPALQAASVRSNGERGRACPRHDYTSPDVFWFTPTELEADDNGDSL